MFFQLVAIHKFIFYLKIIFFFKTNVFMTLKKLLIIFDEQIK